MVELDLTALVLVEFDLHPYDFNPVEELEVEPDFVAYLHTVCLRVVQLQEVVLRLRAELLKVIENPPIQLVSQVLVLFKILCRIQVSGF